MKVHAYFRKAFGIGFDAYGADDHLYLDIYLGPLTIEFMGRDGESGDDAVSTDKRDPASGECQHSWSNWSALEQMEMPTFNMFGGDSPKASVDAVVQTRKCLKCNLHQRARIS